MRPNILAFFFWLGGCWSLSLSAAPPHVALSADQLFVDGRAAPYLFGAEVQYFRARGGPGRNVPAETVYQLWNRLLDRVVEAKMNAVSFYIPWDFHEPREGVFDFDGSLDQDHDGKPDYPSRNLKKFLELVDAHHIRYVLIRPGPYINAEWGPEGFGAVPLWFLDGYPSSLAQSQTPDRPRVVRFSDPTFRDRTRRWFAALYHQVLAGRLGTGKAIVFLQLDNETNFFWDSIYERDWSPAGLADYRRFLRGQFNDDVRLLDAQYGAKLQSFDEATPPRSASDTTYPGSDWHYDWYLFHDVQIADYHRFLRETWESLGVREPDVRFTTCDSFNAADDGLLPRLEFRGGGGLSLSTMNLYPKTSGTASTSTLNYPMKGAHDAALFAAAHGQFYGTALNWVMATETMGGWFPPTEVTLAARQHTYGSLLGTSVKAMMIYYFHEGWNWNGLEQSDSELHFDAPLDKDMAPRPAFGLLKGLGASLAAGLGDRLIGARPISSPILIAHDDYAQYPVPGGPKALTVDSDDSAGIFGWFREAGFLPEVGLLDAFDDRALARFRVVVWSDPGYLPPASEAKLQRFVARGGWVITIGKTHLDAHGSGRAVQLADNPAIDWNSDRYLGVSDASERLGKLRGLLLTAGLTPRVRLATADGDPFVHAWLSATASGDRLLFLENFQHRDRSVTITVDPGVFGSLPSRLRAEPAWNAAGPAVEDSAEAWTGGGVTLPVGADGTDIWLITAAGDVSGRKR